jgi:formiminotetrahydrofolate cyclodeaminase
VDRSAHSPDQEDRATDLLEAPLREVLQRVANETVVPGGGSTTVAAVALAAGLLAMTGRRSRESWREAGGAIGQAEALRDRAAWLVQESANAYERAVNKLREGATSGEQEVRDWELGVVLGRAAYAPLACAEVAADVGELAAEVAERCDPAVRGDAVAAALLAESGVRVGAHLVEINLTVGEGDERMELSRALIARAEQSRARALAAGR